MVTKITKRLNEVKTWFNYINPLYFCKKALMISWGYPKMLESKFQKDVIWELEKRFPNCMILKNDPSFVQGVPDLIILWEDRWAALECKRDCKAKHRPNQDYYVNRMKHMSFASFIFPENMQEVLDELEDYFMA